MVQRKDDYAAWKGWEHKKGPSQAHMDYFAAEMKASGVIPQAKILEVGFGNGEFLQWATAEGYKPVGVEIRPILVEQALEKNLKVLTADLCDSIPESLLKEGPFQAVVALDVLEHLTEEGSISLLNNLGVITSKDAKIVLRFPNGASPFSVVIQNGDYTHQQALTESKLKQLCAGRGWKVHHYGNAARTLAAKGKGGVLRRLVYPMRNLLEIIFGYLYYGHRIPLDPVATAVLIRDHD